MILVIPFLFSCSIDSTTTDDISQIHTDYINYSDEINGFSISYPPELELIMFDSDNVQQTDDTMNTIVDESLPQRKSEFVFGAGIQTRNGYSPVVFINIESLPDDTYTVYEITEVSVAILDEYLDSYKEICRTKTIIDGREAIIVSFQSTSLDGSELYSLTMFTVVDENIWRIICFTSGSSEYEKWESDFNKIIRSFRILR
jgi:hypothetical protein